jgi:hypothetical protein
MLVANKALRRDTATTLCLSVRGLMAGNLEATANLQQKIEQKNRKGN